MVGALARQYATTRSMSGFGRMPPPPYAKVAGKWLFSNTIGALAVTGYGRLICHDGRRDDRGLSA